VPRLFSTALLFVLLGATAGAFVVTEGLKLEPSPVTKVFVTPKIFSPTCECETNLTLIGFRLRKADRLTLSIVDNGNKLVKTLLGPIAQPKGPVAATWDGRNDAGAVVPDGTYRPRVHLRHRTILMPNPIRVDTKPPVLRLHSVRPRVLEPGHVLRVRYSVSEPARVSLFLNGRRIVLGRSTHLTWKLEWRAHGAPGKYHLTADARDVPGNVSGATRPVEILIPLQVLTSHVVARPGSKFVVRLRTDGRAYVWRLHRRRGFALGERLVLTAPAKAGHYTLVIRQDRIEHKVPLVVAKK
jgi:hypothetical protein